MSPITLRGTRPGFKIVGSILFVLLLAVGAYFWFVNYQEQAALTKARAAAEESAETERLKDRLFESELHLIELRTGPAAKAYWRAKETEVRRCEDSSSNVQNAEPCKSLLAAFRKITRPR
jgi:hypothetical protein